MTALGVLASAIVLVSSSSAPAQVLPTRPLSLAGGSVTLGAEVSASWGADDTGYFNYTNYASSSLRRIRAGLSGSWRPATWLSLLGEVRAQNGGGVRLYALYARIRPWPARNVDLQIGRIPPTFGAYARRSYPQDNPLIGDPLIYQYLTSLRPDAVPASANELLLMRGRGWRASYTYGDAYSDTGVPIASVLNWNTGAQIRVGDSPIEIAAAVTTGSLSHAATSQGLETPQYAARAAWKPLPGLIIGASVDQGSFFERETLDALPAGVSTRSLWQRAIGLDVEYSRDHWLLRGEVVGNRWRMPELRSPLIDVPLDAVGWYGEGRYRVGPRLYAAARVDRLGFSKLAGSAGTLTWDAKVTRTETGIGVYLQRNVIMKASWQFNTRDGGRIRRNNLGAVQLLYWF
jgi:hypothetical protein